MNSTTQARSRRLRCLPWAVLCILLAFTFWASSRVTVVTRLKNRWHFNNAVLEVKSSIIDNVNDFTAMLRGGAALAATVNNLNNETFEAFVNRLQLGTYYPGVQGVGFARQVTPDEIDAVEQNMRSDGDANFRIYPTGTRPLMFPVLFLQPVDRRNQQALGYDMFSEPVRHAAMMMAATNGPAISGKVTLVQEIDNSKQPGFLLYVAAFGSSKIPDTPEAREAALRGFIYSPFRAQDFFSSVFRESRASHLHFAIYDGTEMDPSALLYESTNAASAKPWITTNQTLRVANHEWTIAFATTPAFEEILGGKTAVVVPITGASASFIIFAFTFYFVRQHEELLRRGRERDKAQREIESLNRDLERRVEDRTAELRETNTQLESFIYSVAHDLRTPLRSIRGFAEILDEDFGKTLSPAGHDYIARITRSAGDMDGLIRDLLSYSQVSRDRVDLRRVDLNEMLSAIRAQLQPEIDRTKAELTIQSPLPAVQAHAATLQQTLVNLLANALKFVKQGEKPVIRVYAEPATDDRVRLWIEDKGIGIDARHHERIFGVFEQLEPETYGGTGIGLAIVRRAVERMGGKVGVESEVGKGSRFFIELRKA